MVRIVGEVTDLDDVRVGVGVDYDSVTIGPYRFTLGQVEELAQLVVSATWQAGRQAAEMASEVSD
jgi:hypothetical protein